MEITNRLNAHKDLKSITATYTKLGYEEVKGVDLPFEMPRGTYEAQAAYKHKKFMVTFMSIFSALAAIGLVVCGAFQAEMVAFIIVGILFIVGLFGVFVMALSSPKTLTVKVVYTYTLSQQHSNSKGSTTSYHAAVIHDGRFQKYIATDIKIPFKVYNEINTEDDIILLIVGSSISATKMN